MSEPIKGFLYNVAGGIVSSIVVLFLDREGLTSYGYAAFFLYVIALASITFFHVSHSSNFKIDPKEQAPNNVENNDPKNPQDDVLHNVISLIAKYHSQEIPASPKRIADDLNIDPGILLAHMVKYNNEQYITFRNNGKPPESDTAFFLSPKAWELIKIVKA